jgi:hypothetical protein
MRYVLPLVLLAVVSLPAAAQCTPTLTLGGALTPGSTVTASVTGAWADSWTVLLIGETQGSTSLTLGPLGTLSFGLDMPFIPFPMGMTDPNGDASVSFAIPANFPAASLPSTLYFQTVQVDLTFGMGLPSLDSCVSSVVQL